MHKHAFIYFFCEESRQVYKFLGGLYGAYCLEPWPHRFLLALITIQNVETTLSPMSKKVLIKDSQYNFFLLVKIRKKRVT